MTTLTSPRWLSVPNRNLGVVILTIAHFIPLFSTTVLPQSGPFRRFLTLLLSTAAGISIFVHAGLSERLVANLDAGFFWSEELCLIIAELLFSIVAVPIGLWTSHVKYAKNLLPTVILTTFFGAAGQILFFILSRFIRGPTGIEFWMAVRVLIMAAVGFTAGFFAFSNAVFRPKFSSPHFGGFTELLVHKLPAALPFSALLAAALFTSGALRVIAEKNDRERLITKRFDDYFLSLSNLTRARAEGLLYPALQKSLQKNRDALLGSAAFDPILVEKLREVIEAIESPQTGSIDKIEFEKRVIAVNRCLLALGEPYFLEPHTIGSPKDRTKFVLRYRITRCGRYGTPNSPSIPMLRLRRIDDIDIDTPYAGVSYHGIGTILMDHIDEIAVTHYLPLFSRKSNLTEETAGKWKATLRLLHADLRNAFFNQLSKQGVSHQRLTTLSEKIESISPNSMTVLTIRRELSPESTGTLDEITELVARQTEIHEARHATDNDIISGKVFETLRELTTHSLEQQTVSEIRAYLTEIIEGPLGPKFGLATVGRLVISPNARANAYFFAGITILEGLWGEKVRRPDIVEIEGEEGTREIMMPISDKHPGWLSFSRIHGAYADLSSLTDDELKRRAIKFFEMLFSTQYPSVERRR